MLGGLAHAHEGAEPEPFRMALNLPERSLLQRVDVNEALGAHDVKLHQIEQRGPTREELHGGARGGRRDGIFESGLHGARAVGALVNERTHGHYSVAAVFMTPFACFTAA